MNPKNGKPPEDQTLEELLPNAEIHFPTPPQKADK